MAPDDETVESWMPVREEELCTSPAKQPELLSSAHLGEVLASIYVNFQFILNRWFCLREGLLDFRDRRWSECESLSLLRTSGLKRNLRCRSWQKLTVFGSILSESMIWGWYYILILIFHRVIRFQGVQTNHVFNTTRIRAVYGLRVVLTSVSGYWVEPVSYTYWLPKLTRIRAA